MKTKHSNRHRHSTKGRGRRHKRTQRRTRICRGGNMNMFRGSNATAPMMCLAGDSKIPCTRFSTA